MERFLIICLLFHIYTIQQALILLNLQEKTIVMSIIFHHYIQYMQFAEEQIKTEENYRTNKRNKKIQY